MARRARVTLDHLLDLAAALAADRERDPRAIAERDRAIADEVSARPTGAPPGRRPGAVGRADRSPQPADLRDPDADAARLVSWVEAVRRRADDAGDVRASLPSDPAAGGDDARASTRAAVITPGDLPGRRWSAALRAGTTALVALGLVLGWLSSFGVLYHDGRDPVNVIQVIGVYMLLPIALLAVTLVAAGAGLGPVGEAARYLSPGRLVHLLARLAPRRDTGQADALLGRTSAAAAALAPAHKWVVLVASQAFASGFFVGALVGAAGQVVLTDLAFGWTTTLETTGRPLVTLTATLAAPWAWAWPAAAPDAPLIEQTRYFRAQGGIDPDDPATFAQWRRWWPFILMGVAVYATLPRLIAWWAMAAYAGVVRRRVITRVPGAAVLLDRLAPAATWRAEPDRDRPAPHPTAAPANHDPTPPPSPPARDPNDAAPVATRATLAWSDAPLPPDPAAGAALPVGGANSLDDDRAAIARAAASPLPVRVVARGWEPPVLELIDLLVDLREAVGPARLIEVVPLGLDAPLTPDQRRDWSRKIDALGDANLVLIDDAVAPPVPASAIATPSGPGDA